MKRKCLIVVAVLLVPVSRLSSQSDSGDSYSDGVYGYTSLDYDSDSNTMTVYSETDMDSDLQPYYNPEIDLTISDDQNNSYNSFCQQTGPYTDYVTVSCQFTPGSSSNYTASAAHWLLLNVYYSNGCGGVEECNSWIDWGNYQQLEFYQDTEWLGQDWFAPGPEQDNTYESPDLILGGTMDGASVHLNPACGDARDQLIAEYTTFLTDQRGRPWRTTFSPGCSDFVDWNSWGATHYFSADWLSFQTTARGAWTVLQDYFDVGVRDFYDSLGSVPPLSSGYRNPQHEIDVTPQGRNTPQNSRHMAGDAADFATNGQVDWQNYQAADLQLGSTRGCVEPAEYQGSQSNPDYGHIHLDWRYLYGQTGTFRYSLNQCPNGW